MLPVPKLFFGYARDMATLFTFGVGAAGIVFPERSTPELLFELIERHRPTIMVQVPTMMSAMLEHPGAERARPLVAAPLPLVGRGAPRGGSSPLARRLGVEVLEGIGSSELYHIYLSNRPGARPPRQRRPARARLRGPIARRGGNGPFQTASRASCGCPARAPALCYWGDQERSKRTFTATQSAPATSSSATPTAFYWYRGRADDLLKVGGIWVAPLEIENCLLRHPAVAECAVVGYEESGLTLPARVRRRCAAATRSEARGELQDVRRGELSPHKYPRDVRFVAELPKTATGKVDRKSLEREPSTAASTT